MHGRQSADHNVIFDGDVTGQSCDVGHDDLIAQGDVVRDVAIGEDIIARTHSCDLTVARGAVDRYIFAEGVVVADFRAGRSPLPFQVLCFQPKTGEGKYLVPPPEGGVSVNDHVGMQPATGTQRDMFADDAIRSDLTVIADSRLGMNDRGRMDQGHGGSGR